MGKIQCSYPLLFMAALLVAFDSGGELILLLAAAGIHELGHLAAIRLLGAEIRGIRLAVGGMVIDYNGSRLSYFGDMVTALAGPAASILAAVFFSLVARSQPLDGLFYFTGLNLLLGLFNLVPVLPLDGGRAVLSLLTAAKGPAEAEMLCGAMTRLFGALLLVLGGWLIVRYQNPSLMLVSLLLLMGDGDKNTLQERSFGVL